MMLVIPLLLLVFVEASGLPMLEHPLSLDRKAIQQFSQVSDKLNGLNLKNVRDTRQVSGSKLQDAVKELADKVHGMMDAVSLKRRVVEKGMMSKKENKPDNVISWVFDNLAFNKRDLQNAMLMKKENLNRQLGLNAEKVASVDARALKNDLLLKRDLKSEQHLKEVDSLASNLLDLKSLHERTLNPSLKGKLKKNVEIRKSIERLYAGFDWFPWKQGMLQKSARGVNQREQSKDDHVSLSSNFDWFPWKQEMIQKSARGVNQREQSKDDHASLSTNFDWFPWKQEKIQKSARGVNQREQSKDDHASLSSNFDWFPWKQEIIQKSARGVNQREQSKDDQMSLSSNFDWFPWSQEINQKSARGVNQREQSNSDHESLTSKFDWFPRKQQALHDTVRDIKSAMKQTLPRTIVSKPLPAKAMRDLDSNFAWDWKKADFYKQIFKRDQDNFFDF